MNQECMEFLKAAAMLGYDWVVSCSEYVLFSTRKPSWDGEEWVAPSAHLYTCGCPLQDNPRIQEPVYINYLLEGNPC